VYLIELPGWVVMNNALESFFAATAMLVSAGPIKHRLLEAYRQHLAPLEQEQLPKEIREEFCSLSSGMSSVRPLRGETALQATVRKMSDVEAGLKATQIVNMLQVIARAQGQQRTPKLRAVNSNDD
jgi:hypothetical protein